MSSMRRIAWVRMWWWSRMVVTVVVGRWWHSWTVVMDFLRCLVQSAEASIRLSVRGVSWTMLLVGRIWPLTMNNAVTSSTRFLMGTSVFKSAESCNTAIVTSPALWLHHLRRPIVAGILGTDIHFRGVVAVVSAVSITIIATVGIRSPAPRRVRGGIIVIELPCFVSQNWGIDLIVHLLGHWAIIHVMVHRAGTQRLGALLVRVRRRRNNHMFWV